METDETDVIERYELAMSMQDIHGFVSVSFGLVRDLVAALRTTRATLAEREKSFELWKTAAHNIQRELTEANK